MIGKKVLNNVYWHYSVTTLQNDNVQQHISAAEQLSNLQPGIDYNVIKYTGESLLSFLTYANFFEAPFPVLETSYRIDVINKRVDKRSYQSSINPPILHRKELLLSPNDPNVTAFREITATAEQLGLFDNPIHIGFKQAWDELIAEKGFKLVGNEFVPIGNHESPEEENIDLKITGGISRHLTALSRSNLSAPMQCLARHGYLDGSLSIFDYGCGKGDDIRNLSLNNINVSGWDPHYAPDQPKNPADIVNLGFVINVIENYNERLQALQGAYELAHQLLVVSAMLLNQNAFKGQTYNDGVVTQRNTFQKYFTQPELKDFISEILDTEAIPVAPGIFYIFKDSDTEQRFLLNRQRNRRNVLRLSHRPITAKEPKLSRQEKKYLSVKHLIDPLWLQTLELGRLPDKAEIIQLPELIANFGTVNKALRYMLDHQNEEILAEAQATRTEDLITYFALQTFTKRKAYKHFESNLQKDIKAFFGDYKNALVLAQDNLYQISKPELIIAACQKAVENGLGYLDDEHALTFHSQNLQQLPTVLRIYIGCATVLYGDIEQTDLIKIHSQSGKLSLMRYENFENEPLPKLVERVKINLRAQIFDVYQYGEDYEPTYLYLKSRFINEEFPNYAEQLYFDEQLQGLNLFDLSGYGPKPTEFRETLSSARWQIEGFNLVRSKNIPELDHPCGRYLTYRQLIECGETQQANQIPNLPKQSESYNALYDLAVNILDPVIDYFGMIKLTYGFCSHDLGKLIKKRVAPKLDQHAAHELNSKGNLICQRLGAAVDFIIEDENMGEVSDWVAENTPFDRLYFYGKNRSIHVSYSAEPKREIIDILLTDNRRQVPKKRHY